jgi:hypothetical protein
MKIVAHMAIAIMKSVNATKIGLVRHAYHLIITMTSVIGTLKVSYSINNSLTHRLIYFLSTGWLILDAPHIPKFLFFCFIILVIALIGAAFIVKKRVIQPTPPVSFSTPMTNERVPIFASKKPAWL